MILNRRKIKSTTLPPCTTPTYPTTLLPYTPTKDTHMNTDPYTLFTQGKITCAQFTRMLRHELVVMRIAHECRMEDNKKKPTCVKYKWAYETEEAVFDSIGKRRFTK